MPSSSTLLLFVLASYALAIVPGPAVLNIVNRSLGQGRRAGVLSALGIATGGAVHMLLAAVGLSALLASSGAAFFVVKVAGGLYLVYLGYRAFRGGEVMIESQLAAADNARIYGQGVVVNLLNPKTALFFVSYLPQFVRRDAGSVVPQMALLGVIFVVCALSSDMVYALGSARIRSWLLKYAALRRAQRYLSAAIFAGLGITAMLAG